MTRYMTVSAIALIAASTPSLAQDLADQADTITGEAIAAHVEILASDAFEGRSSGTHGETLTIEYISSQFADAGVEPGMGESYFQPFQLVKRDRTGEQSLIVTGPEGVLDLELGRDYMVYTGRPGERIEVTASELVFAGFGIVAEEDGWDDYESSDLSGKTVVLFRGDPGTLTQDETLFDGIALSVHGTTSQKYERAAERGARAAIVIHTDASAGFPWSVIGEGGVGSSQYYLGDDDDAKLDIVVHMREGAARDLLAAAGFDLDGLSQVAVQPDFSAFDLDLQADAISVGSQSSFTTNNVVGFIEGSEAPEECVVYTAHWDHVGMNEDTEGEDIIYNGAVDNAVGTSMLIEIASAFARMEAPRRSVYFFATAAEERGLYGAEYFADNPPCEQANIVAALNMDAHFPFADRFDGMTVPGLGTSEVEDYFAEAAARYGRVLQPDPSPQAGAFFRSDHWPFIKVGIPAIFAVGGPTAEQFQSDESIAERFGWYMTQGYHKPDDEYDPGWWRMGGIETDARIYFEAGAELANSDVFPNFTEGTAYRLLRDEMRAGQ